MIFRSFLLLLLFSCTGSAFWPFTGDADAENDLDQFSEDSSDYFNRCLDFHTCAKCYKIKEEGKCANHTSECRKTCTGCEGPDIDRYGTVKCQYYKNQGYCDYLSFKSFKCQKTCGNCAVDGNWGKWSAWSACSKTCKQGSCSRQRNCDSPAPQYGGKTCPGDPSENKVCNENVPCPVDGKWGSWSEWSACSKTCKQGKKSRERECNSPAPQYGGKNCEGQSNQENACNKNVPCPVDGNWGKWSQWSTCSKTCRQGNQTRSRECNSPAPKYGGNPCSNQAKETRVCNADVPCPVDGNWGKWSQWSTCSKTCRQGNQTRSRECNSPAPKYGGKPCSNQAKETRVCNKDVPCPVDGNWGKWSQWSTCSKTCRQGNQTRSRECNSPAPKYGGKPCSNQAKEARVCNKDVPCPVDGNWGKWSQWSTCSKTCRQGNQTRSRECNSPAPKYGGKPCSNQAKETRVCNADVPCPVDGSWGKWSQWSTCSKTCSQGNQTRSRECNSPAPQYGGKPCSNQTKETRVCNADVPCPVDGNWGKWSQWSTCSKTCRQGNQTRSRECNSPAPKYGGKPCSNQAKETRVCNADVPCPVDGNWGDWSKWSTCSKTCKQGKKSRERQCNSPAPQYGGKNCKGDSKQEQVCNKNVQCPVDGNWGQWSEWSACSKSCQQGQCSRQRKCDSPAPQYGGKACEGDSVENKVCNKHVPCPVDGNWGEWNQWSSCSKTCKQGTSSRQRKCDSPAPQYGGNECEGESSEDRVCNKDVPCPVDGNWGTWSEWSACSKTCKQGSCSRQRNCDSPAPQYGGKTCLGDSSENKVCNKNVPCPVDGTWGKWSSWSACSKTCKQGQQSRTRECDSPAPKYGGTLCSGDPNETIACNKDVPCPVDGMWGSWSSWTACSTTCGYGTRERNRHCDSPKPAYNGSPCPGVGYQKRRCHAYYPCPIDGNWTSWGAWTTCTKTCGLSYRKRSRSCTNPSPQYGGSGCEGKNDEVERCFGQACY